MADQNAVVSLTIDSRTDRESQCSDCGRVYRFVTGFVDRDGNATAVYHAQCHGHDVAEAWLDVVIDDPDASEFTGKFTFSCRVSIGGAGLVDAPAAASGEADYFGRLLSRAEALENDRLGEVWDIVDLVVTEDPTVHAHIYGSPA